MGTGIQADILPAQPGQLRHPEPARVEQLEDGLIDETDFRTFAFSNSVQLYGGANPSFFDGTRIETEARTELKSAALK